MKIFAHGNKQPGRLSKSVSQLLTMRTIVIFLLCLAGSLLFVTSIRASQPPGTNKIQNPDFESGNHLSPWFKSGTGNAGAENCCGQHETYYWPHGQIHQWSSLYNTGDTWDGYIWNENQSGTISLALVQNISSLTANQRYRLSAWIATSSGNTAYLRWNTNTCKTTTATWPGRHVMWPTSLNLSCEFTLSSTSGFNVNLFGYLSTGQWVISDDWAFTQLVTVPPLGWPLVGPLPIRYWAKDYANSVDRAVNNWEAATGRNLFERATSEANAQLIIDGVDVFSNGTAGGDSVNVAWTYYPGAYIGAGKQLIEVNLWHFSKWTSDPKVSSIGHELGHVLNLYHVDSCQLMRGGPETRYYHCGVVQPTSKDASSVP